jgi:hypothetical protein
VELPSKGPREQLPDRTLAAAGDAHDDHDHRFLFTKMPPRRPPFRKWNAAATVIAL